MEEPRNNPRFAHPMIVARGCVVLGLVASLYGNVAAGWPDPVLTGFGVTASLGLPSAVALWRSIPAAGWWPRLRRGTVMFVIALAAATYTFAHVVSLQRDHGQHPVLAVCVTALVEGLVVMAVLTLHAAAAQPAPAPTVARPPTRKAVTPPPASPPVAQPTTPPSAANATVTPLPTRPTGLKRDQAIAWLRTQQAAGRDLTTITAAEVDRAIGGNDYARKHLADWRASVHTAAAEASQ